MTEHPLRGRYPSGAVELALTALEAVRPDYPEGGAIRRAVDDALHGLYRFREIETSQASAGTPSEEPRGYSNADLARDTMRPVTPSEDTE